MKITLAIVLCLAALAYGRPAKGKGPGGPVVGKLVGLCLRLLEDAVDDPSKRSWEDVFGALAPVCEELLKMGKPDDGDGDRGSGRKPGGGRGSGDGRKPPGSGDGRRPPGSGDGGRGSGDSESEDDDGSGDDADKRGRGSGGRGSGDKPRGSGDKPRGSGDGSGDDKPDIFMGLYKVCASLHELFEAASDMEKRSWEDIMMSLYNVCEDAKAQMEADEAEAELEERMSPGTRKTHKCDTCQKSANTKYRLKSHGRGKGNGGDKSGKPDAGSGGKGKGGKESDSDDGDNEAEVNTEVYQKGVAVVMNLIRLCEGLAKLGEDEQGQDKRDWLEIFMAVGDICYATEAQIKADMAPKEDGSGDLAKLMERGMGKGKGGKENGKGKGKPAPGGGSGDGGDSGEEENPAETLLDICEDLLELEEEEMKRRGDKRSLAALTAAMKDVCDMAFAQAEADEAE